MANEITGNQGVNTIFFSGERDDYIILEDQSCILVIDKQNCRDGVNTLYDIERLQFTDETIYIY